MKFNWLKEILILILLWGLAWFLVEGARRNGDDMVYLSSFIIAFLIYSAYNSGKDKYKLWKTG